MYFVILIKKKNAFTLIAKELGNDEVANNLMNVIK